VLLESLADLIKLLSVVRQESFSMHFLLGFKLIESFAKECLEKFLVIVFEGHYLFEVGPDIVVMHDLVFKCLNNVVNLEIVFH